MKCMNYDDFLKSVEEARWESVYFFTGPEELNKREALAALRRAILPPGLEQLNDATLEGVSAQTIIDAAETLPVMCDRRIVTVRNWAPLLPGKSKNEDAEVERMLQWLQAPPESCILLFWVDGDLKDDAKKDKKKEKTLVSTLDALPGHVQFDHLSGAPLHKWCSEQLKPVKKKISANTVNELTMMAGQELTRISGELKKLAAYVEDRTEITVDDLRAVVTPTPEYSAFMILDHLLAGRLAQATQVVDVVLQTEILSRVIALLTSQLRTDAHVKLALEAKTPTAEICKMMGFKNSNRLFYIQRQVRSIPVAVLEQGYLDCVAADYAIKSGKLRDRAALDALLLKLLRN